MKRDASTEHFLREFRVVHQSVASLRHVPEQRRFLRRFEGSNS